MMKPPIPRVRIYHNNLWARYKGVIFSKIYANSAKSGIATHFVQVAETSRERQGLPVDRSYHQYPFDLLFPKSYDEIPRFRVVAAVTANVFANPCELVVLPGYHRIEYWAMLSVCILLRRKRAVFCDSTAYDREKYRWKERAKAIFFRRCDGFFCYGQRSKEYVASYGIPVQKIFDRCQSAALPPDYDVVAIRSHYDSDSCAPAPKFLYIGRLAQEKGLEDLLEALRDLRQELPEAKLDIVGSGPLRAELAERTRRLGLDSAVAFLGAKSPAEIGRLLMDSTAMILPSHREPWGLVVNEALSYGCPVVVSSICGCLPELVSEGITGYSFPVGDIRALTKAMIAVTRLSKNRALVARQCLDLIGLYTPERAAAEILRGCVSILKTPE
jgi:glycosyltransferase involved in cell wall biosynthesis